MFALVTSIAEPAAPAGGETLVNSPMPGSVMKVLCSVGQTVNEGDLLIVLEAMKMEIEVFAPCAGTVKSVVAAAGASVASGDVLATIG